MPNVEHLFSIKIIVYIFVGGNRGSQNIKGRIEICIESNI